MTTKATPPLSWFALLSVLFLLSGARAEDARESPTAPSEPETQFREAMQHYEASRFDRAAAILDRLSRERAEPLFSFNLGQAQRRRGDCKAAVAAYRRYLADEPPSGEGRRAAARASALRYVAQLEPCPEVRQSAAVIGTTIPALRAPRDVPVPMVQDVPAREVRAARGWIAVGLALGLGVASATVAIQQNVRAQALERSLERRFETAAAPWDARAERDYEEGERSARRARGFAAVGGALVVLGATMLVFTSRERARRSRVDAQVALRAGRAR